MGHFPSSGPSSLHEPLYLQQREVSPWVQERSSSKSNSGSVPLEMCISSGCVWEKGKIRHVGQAWQLGKGRVSQVGRSYIKRDKAGMTCPQQRQSVSYVWCQPASGWHNPQNDLIHCISMEKQTNTKQVGEAAKSRGDTVAAWSQPFSLASGDTIAGCSLSHEQGEVFRVQMAESCHPRLWDLGLAVLSTFNISPASQGERF